MIFFCDNCKYINECKPCKNNSQVIGCCDFGLFDENGLIEDWDKLMEEAAHECEVNGYVILLYKKYRDATPEEVKGVYDYINSISKPTGITFDKLEEKESDE